MKLIIDISEEDYNNIEPFLNGQTIKGGFDLFEVLKMIKHGTPLDDVKHLLKMDWASPAVDIFLGLDKENKK